MDTLTRSIHSVEDMEREAQSFINALAAETSSATLITLSGELGAGKTAFTKAVAKALGFDGTVNSPTFVLEKIYSLDSARDPEPFRQAQGPEYVEGLVEGLDCFGIPHSGTPRNDNLKQHRST